MTLMTETHYSLWRLWLISDSAWAPLSDMLFSLSLQTVFSYTPTQTKQWRRARVFSYMEMASHLIHTYLVRMEDHGRCREGEEMLIHSRKLVNSLLMTRKFLLNHLQ